MKTYISLKNRFEFDRVYNNKNSCGNKNLVMYICKNELNVNRLGLSISKKVGNSVVRHRIGRLIKESYRLNDTSISNGYDIVIVARTSVVGKSYQEVEGSLLHLFKLHKLLCKADYK
ncbi:MAG: ribonuclease P protein component [Firmicutes bacterium HGW-Firmicutes-1]|jgi:ribonuclease P protein component|nr:MAG: ribonuclease P protein component [Firmicutes bacterium HGW-Firmicutes-1]